MKTTLRTLISLALLCAPACDQQDDSSPNDEGAAASGAGKADDAEGTGEGDGNTCEATDDWWNDCTANLSIFACSSDLAVDFPDAASCCSGDESSDPLFCETALNNQSCEGTALWWNNCTAELSIFACESDLAADFPDAAGCCSGDEDSDPLFCDSALRAQSCEDASDWWDNCTANLSIFACESDLAIDFPDAQDCCTGDEDADPLFCGRE